MNFRGHLIGGALAGVATASVASRWGYIAPQDYGMWAAVCGTTVFFSLFPDFDTASVPQRWFFRAVLAFMVYLGWSRQFELATLVGMLSILPLIDRHRGWTHWKISPLVVPVLLGALYEYWRTRNAWIGGFDWAQVEVLLEGHLALLAASVIGWYTHLMLDGQFKVFPTDRDHH